MKKSRLFVLFGTIAVGLLALCWSPAQLPGRPLKVVDPTTGKEIHTLPLDQENSLVGLLEAAGQTNAIELFRQYRCADRAALASSELGDTIAVLQYLREGQKDQAIYLLEQHLYRYVGLMCNAYGGLNSTNRERVNLKSLEQARDYFATFPHPEWGTATDRAMNEVLRLSSEKPKK